MSLSKEIDLQQLALRVIHAYQEFDTKLCTARLTGIETYDRVPVKTYLIPPFTELPTVQYVLDCYQNDTPAEELYKLLVQPSVDDFFAPKVLETISTKKELEDIYWRIRLMYGCGLLPIALIELTKMLRRKRYGRHAYFVAHVINSEGKAVKEKIYFQNIAVRTLDFAPKIIHMVQKNYGFGVVRTEQVEMMFGRNYAAHNILICNNKWVLDMTSLQFGVRGRHGELVGRLEPIQSFLERFPGHFVNLNASNPVQEAETVGRLLEMNKNIIQSTAKQVVGDILNERKWCNYCGKVLVKWSWCAACGVSIYCEKYCQKADWKSHKRFCKKKE